TDRRKGFLVSAYCANLRNLAGNLRCRDPIAGEWRESVHQLGKVRQLGDASELSSAARKAPASVRELCRDVRVRQLPRREQEPAIGLQPQHLVESKAPLERVRGQGLRLETE